MIWFKAFAGRSAHSVSMKIAPWVMLVAVAAVPTPSPVALQYDEISRVIIAPATVPPPGAFEDEYKLAMATRAAQATQYSSIEAPTPQSHMDAAKVGESTAGEPGGANSGLPPDQPLPAPRQTQAPAGAMHLVRWTFYLTKGWVREDDPIAHTAVIAKCDQQTMIMLNIAKKTYTQTPTDCAQTAASQRAPNGAMNAATPQDLGSKTIDGIATTGTGTKLAEHDTCVVYVSKIPKPRTTLLAEQSACGLINSMLEMYVVMNTTINGRSASDLTERGHLTALDASAADPLFEIPAGFTPAR
jgi:hypothetical protein